MLDLYYDRDTFGFRKNILLPLLNEYIKHLGEQNNYMALIFEEVYYLREKYTYSYLKE